MKWIYKVIYRRQPMEEDQLNRLGEEGWELCGMRIWSTGSFFDSQRIVYYFKRQKV